MLATASAPSGAVTGTQFMPKVSRIAVTVLLKSALSLSSPVMTKATEARPPSLQAFHARRVPTCTPAVASTVISAKSEARAAPRICP